MSSVVIGKRELLSFAERHACRRVRDFSSLADGEVIILLLNKLFPSYRIRVASYHTHSISQRTQFNWEAVYRTCSRLRIPLSLLHYSIPFSPRCSGFSLLALFYFLFHLSKRIDFSAEFANEMPDDLMNYLQSMDSIVTLFLGEALEWSCIPEEVGEQIRSMPAFHTSPEEERDMEEAAAQFYKEQLLIAGKRLSSVSSLVSQQNMLQSAQEKKAFSAPQRDHSTVFLRATPPPLGPSAPVSPKSSTPLPDLNDTREARLLNQLSAKTKECELLRNQEIKLLDRLAQVAGTGGFATGSADLPAETRSSEMIRLMYEVEHERAASLERHLTGPRKQKDEGIIREEQRNKRSVSHNGREALLDDITHPDSREVIEAHCVANALHLSILAAPDSPAKEEGIALLQVLWCAYSELEKRLVKAVTMMDDGVDMPPRKVSEAPSRPSLRHASREDNQLGEQCRTLLRGVEEIRRSVDAFTTSTRTREEKWRSLCAKLYQVERDTFRRCQLLEQEVWRGGSAASHHPQLHEIESVRVTSYAEIECLTEELLRLPSAFGGSTLSRAEGHEDLVGLLDAQIDSLWKLAEDW